MTPFDAGQLPVPEDDTVTAPWWHATRERHLLVQRCSSCGNHQHYPRPICLTCGSIDVKFVEAAGTGTVHAFTVVHRPPHPGLEHPYVIALVDLTEGPRLLTRLRVDPHDARCDVPVKVTWWPLPDGRALPVFEPEEP